VEQRRHLRCLGQPVLFAPNGEPVRFRTKKHLALLIYIAVEPRSHRRDRLAELLWPKVTPIEARHSLATALSTLRPRLGPEGLESGRDHVHLAPGRVTLDLERLDAGDVLGTEVTGPLEVAAFLDGFDVPDSSEFTHWKDRQQARLLPMIKDALVVLIDRCRRTADSRQIERLADKMLALDYLSEEAIRAKMEARAFAGDRLTALEIYEEWKVRLAEDLQAVPSDLVEGMAIRLRRRGWERMTLPKIPNVPTDQWRGRPFIGRTAEYRALYEAWEDVRRGSPRHALILGDSGVGKSTLVERLTTAAGLEGAAISRVQCYDLEREIPYSTLSSLVLGLLDRPGVSATAPESLADLSRTIPEVRRRFPNIPRPQDSEGEASRIRLTEAFLDTLTAISEEHPVILVVDDLHLADDVSLAVLHLIMRRARGQPIMMVFVARAGELHLSPQGTGLRESSNALGIGEIELLPLTPVESLEMLKSLIATDEPRPRPAVERALLRAAAGYPMALELLVQDWQESGEQSLALSVDAMTETPSFGAPVGVVYRQILERITHLLGATTRHVLNLASLLGQRLNDLNMYTLIDLSVGEAMIGMADLVTHRVLRDGAQGLEFVNEMVRASAYVGVSQTLRKALHGKIADRFIETQAFTGEMLGLEIAWHCVRAGRVQEATAYLLQGAREAIRSGAVQSAEKALSTAVPHLSGQERSDAILLLVEILQEQGRWDESLTVLREYAPQNVEDAKLVFTVMAELWSTAPAPEWILENLEHLRKVIEGDVAPSIRVRAAKAASTMMTRIRDVPIAKRFLASVNTIPRELPLDELTRLADCKAQLLYSAMDYGSCLSEIVEVAEQLRGRRLVNSTLASLHTGLGMLACFEGRYFNGKDELRRAYDIYASLGNETLRGVRAAQVALCCFRVGEFDEAIQWSDLAMATFGLQFAGYVECQTALYTGSSYALQGDYKKALCAVNHLDSRFPPTAPPWLVQAWGLHKADILQLSGQQSAALLVAHKALGKVSPLLYAHAFGGAFARWLAMVFKGGPSVETAREQIQHMLQRLERFDALDQVEILCSGESLECGSNLALENVKTLIASKLAKLPAGTGQHLARLGLTTSPAYSEVTH
jgi:DNA-binding SARP family transcriptional activator/tetratricopeptide (TPR) repeat protein/Cdc6-like AAA superfamily ATPase